MREVIPHPQQMRVAQGTSLDEQASIGGVGHGIQQRPWAFFQLQRTKEHLIVHCAVDSIGLVIGERQGARPHLGQCRPVELRDIEADNRIGP